MRLAARSLYQPLRSPFSQRHPVIANGSLRSFVCQRALRPAELLILLFKLSGCVELLWRFKCGKFRGGMSCRHWAFGAEDKLLQLSRSQLSLSSRRSAPPRPSRDGRDVCTPRGGRRNTPLVPLKSCSRIAHFVLFQILCCKSESTRSANPLTIHSRANSNQLSKPPSSIESGIPRAVNSQSSTCCLLCGLTPG